MGFWLEDYGQRACELTVLTLQSLGAAPLAKSRNAARTPVRFEPLLSPETVSHVEAALELTARARSLPPLVDDTDTICFTALRMFLGWMTAAALMYAILPGLEFLPALVLAAGVTPTDPILASSVVGKGKYAQEHVPSHIRHVLQAESGCNDGAAFPFLVRNPLVLRCSGSQTDATLT